MEKWTNEQREELKKLYIKTNVPSDSLIKNAEALSHFTNTLNAHLACQSFFAPEQVASELLRIRKSGKLPKIRN